jgi:hypothetical protein
MVVIALATVFGAVLSFFESTWTRRATLKL